MRRGGRGKKFVCCSGRQNLAGSEDARVCYPDRREACNLHIGGAVTNHKEEWLADALDGLGDMCDEGDTAGVALKESTLMLGGQHAQIRGGR